MDIDWEKRWSEYNNERGVGFAMSCSCGGAAGFCNCTKKQWIECEKEKLGLPHEKMFSCDFCGNRKTFVYRTWDLQTKLQKDICETCSKNREVKN
jgi:hypothetical protein